MYFPSQGENKEITLRLGITAVLSGQDAKVG
jgi:hypothetical protein